MCFLSFRFHTGSIPIAISVMLWIFSDAPGCGKTVYGAARDGKSMTKMTCRYWRRVVPGFAGALFQSEYMLIQQIRARDGRTVDVDVSRRVLNEVENQWNDANSWSDSDRSPLAGRL